MKEVRRACGTKILCLGKDRAHKRIALSAAGVLGQDDLGMFLTVACDACSFNTNSGKGMLSS